MLGKVEIPESKQGLPFVPFVVYIEQSGGHEAGV